MLHLYNIPKKFLIEFTLSGYITTSTRYQPILYQAATVQKNVIGTNRTAGPIQQTMLTSVNFPKV